MVYKNTFLGFAVFFLILLLGLPGLVTGQENNDSSKQAAVIIEKAVATPGTMMEDSMMNMSHSNTSDMAGGNRSANHNYSDRAYLSGMIVHHEAAVDMARDVLKNGKDSQVRKWAEEVITAQEREINQMKQWLSGMGGTDSRAADMMNESMHSMMGHSSGDADVDFVSMMIGHHAGAVDMATEAIVNSTDEKVISLSRDIIFTQVDEIIAYKKWLSQN